MKQVLWFRRDLRITDSAILFHAKKEVLPLFIFDTNILDQLESNDKRITFIYDKVLALKKQLQGMSLDLKILYGNPVDIFKVLQQKGYQEVLCSMDFDAYAIKRDKEIEHIMPMHRFIDSFLLHPKEHLKKDGTPYKVFTPFYKALKILTHSKRIEPYGKNGSLRLCKENYTTKVTLESMGFKKQVLPAFAYNSAEKMFEQLKEKMPQYIKNRDLFFMQGSSNMALFLRFGVISIKELFNVVQSLPSNNEGFIRQLFWREFYAYILYHNPRSQFENFNGLQIPWNNNEDDFKKWCRGQTGVPIVDAAMQYLNKTGCMHNRLRMVTASFLTKNLLIDWKKGEAYFAQKLLDYEASSNIGSWQWSASTGADAVPYFRVFNPYLQSKKFDKDTLFIKKVLPQLKEVPAQQLHIQNGFNALQYGYIPAMVDIKSSREKVISLFKAIKNKKM